MISVDKAYRLIDTCVADFGTEKTHFVGAVNRVLTEPVFADRDFPPFDRVTMDGIAINSEAFANGARNFFIEKVVAAGTPIVSLEGANNCIEVMTGAMLPSNTNAVIPYEQCEIIDGTATVNVDAVIPCQNIHQQGTDDKKGAVLIEKDTLLSPAHISVLATVAKTEVEVYKQPSISIFSTGDELVDIYNTPLPHQIRQSNGYFITADLHRTANSIGLQHLPDDLKLMKRQLSSALKQHDAILLSGAVSKGKFDFLPQALEELGMKTIFHHVAQRPGKPFLFGVLEEKPVFAFPGNPVSTFVCYHLYFKRWLNACLHKPAKKISAKLSAKTASLPSLTNHVLVKITYENGECLAEPVAFSTSGDIPSLLNADGIISLPPQKEPYQKGEVFEVIMCR